MPKALSPEQAREELESVLKTLQQLHEPLKKRFQAVLKGMSGASYGTYQANAQVARDLNAVRKALGLRFKLPGTTLPVNFRCVKPPRSKKGAFQARSCINGGQRTDYAGAEIPPLEIRDENK